MRAKVAELTAGCNQGPGASHQATALGRIPDDRDTAEALACNEKKRFGKFGGQFIPETLLEAFREFEEAYDECKEDVSVLLM